MQARRCGVHWCLRKERCAKCKVGNLANHDVTFGFRVGMGAHMVEFRFNHRCDNLQCEPLKLLWLNPILEMMMPTAILPMIDGVKVVVPDSLNLITPYVLCEQQDWFEDEIKFLRHLLQPGHKVIDIGANYGVYTLSMAKTVGSTGCVWAFEPASSTANLLAEGIAVNGFAQVTLERSALSSSKGTAQLSLNQNSELNALIHGQLSTSASETVPLVTLDDCMETYGWRDIEFVKIDAEGEEANILKGGKRFFSELSPLIQYEVKAGTDLHMELVQDFASFGYDSYRLVPGLNLLVPFNVQSQPDGYLLNLFCCKPDRAALLASRSFLLDSVGLSTGKERLKDLSEKIRGRNAYDWSHNLAKLPYGALLAKPWEKTMATGLSGEVDEALSYYAISRDSSLSAAERFCALEASFSCFKILCDRQSSHLRLASLARVARDYGARTLAVNALTHLSNTILKSSQMDPSEPFLVPDERFDSVPPGEPLGNWILAAVLEALERLAYFSSFYAGNSVRQRLEIIRDLGFGSAEMQRRLNLLQQRFGS
jgi:protein O-GlcNAc transferase